MDAKSKADFINSVASGQMIPCPQCNQPNEPNAALCAACGAQMAPAAEPAATEPAAPAAVSSVSVVDEEHNIFAKGMPNWDIVPPEMAIRRKKR